MLVDIENLTGSAQGDTLIGNSDANVLDGSGGDDLLIGGAGADSLIGGAGNDTVSYAASAVGVWVRLSSGSGSGGDADGDTLAGIENIVGSAFDDTLGGDSGANVLDGGAGNDTVSYADSGAGVVIDLESGIVAGGDAEGDTLVSIENIEGSAFADTINGDSGTNLLSGGDGDDELLGLGGGVFPSGDDTLLGGAGNDRLIDEDGNDVLVGGTGNDYLAGGGLGVDFMTGGTGTDIFSVGQFHVVFDPSNTTTITDFEGGSDVIILGVSSPFDVLSQAFEQDGNVHIHYDLFTPEKELILLDTTLAEIPDSTFIFGNPFVITGSEGADTLTGGIHRDAIFGFGGDDVIDAGDGDDYLSGGEGGDTLLGGAGDDLILGGAGADQIDGGDGYDTLSYAGSAAGVSVNLTPISLPGAPPEDAQPQPGIGGDAEGDLITGIEALIGSDFANELVGSAGDNLIEGGQGADSLSGGDGNDTVLGGEGDDDIRELNGDDIIDGGAGNDFIFDINGADTISGGDGDDDISAGFGDDIISGGDGADRFLFFVPDIAAGETGEGADVITDYDVGIDQIWFQGDPDFDPFAVMSYDGQDTVIDLGGGNSVTLENVNANLLTDADFHIVQPVEPPVINPGALDGDLI